MQRLRRRMGLLHGAFTVLPSVLVFQVVCLLAAPRTLGQPLAPDLPRTFAQGHFIAGDQRSHIYPTYDKKKLRMEAFIGIFDAAEVGVWGLDTDAGRNDVRTLSSALRDLSNERAKTFYAYYSLARLPGFFDQAAINAQPAAWRAKALKSNGSFWNLHPPEPALQTSKITFTGEALDITNSAAVNSLLSNLAVVFAQGNPSASSVGPLYGYVMFAETKLLRPYDSYWIDTTVQSLEDRDVDSPTRRMRMNPSRTHLQLYDDNDPAYSFFTPPKRAVPLFSQGAAQSFAGYAASRGFPQFTKLPADRGEFNDDDSSLVALPSWVQYVSLGNTSYWAVWEDWVYATWSGFMDQVASTITQAQAGNSHFKGIVLFQNPIWYSFRNRSTQPVTYQYHDSGGVLRTATTTLSSHPEYKAIDSVVHGNDMEYLLSRPWCTGVIHETDKHVFYGGPERYSLSPDAYDIFIENHDRFRTYFLAKGAIVEEVARQNGVEYGMFARPQYFQNQNVLPPARFVSHFDRTILLQKPDVVATIGPHWFVNSATLPQPQRDVMPNGTGELAANWLAKIGQFRGVYFPTITDLFNDGSGSLAGRIADDGSRSATWAAANISVAGGKAKPSGLDWLMRADVPVGALNNANYIALEASLRQGATGQMRLGFAPSTQTDLATTNGAFWLEFDRSGNFNLAYRNGNSTVTMMSTDLWSEAATPSPAHRYRLEYAVLTRQVRVLFDGVPLTGPLPLPFTPTLLRAVAQGQRGNSTFLYAADNADADDFRVIVD